MASSNVASDGSGEPLTISERFNATNEIATKLSISSANLTWEAAIDRAREIEAEIHKSSASPEAYRQALIELDESSLRVDPGTASKDDDKNNRLLSGRETNLGDYPSCYFYTDGRSSDIFVSRAKDGQSEDLVALKVSVSSAAPHNHIREARMLGKLAGGNEHVIRLLETFRNPNTGAFVMVMPFYRHTLDDYIESGFEDQKSLRRVFKQILSSLAYIHSHGIIHRDVKSSNILLKTPIGPACLCDFGIAWSSEDHDLDEPEGSKVIEIGTTNYRPPETLFGYQTYGPEVDMWAFGCVIAEMELHNSLFDAGDLGSELALIASIFQTLGTPAETMWPEAKNCPDYGKMVFKEFPTKPWKEILPNADDNVRDLVAHLVNYSKAQRFTALEAMEHPYFQEI